MTAQPEARDRDDKTDRGGREKEGGGESDEAAKTARGRKATPAGVAGGGTGLSPHGRTRRRGEQMKESMDKSKVFSSRTGKVSGGTEPKRQ